MTRSAHDREGLKQYCLAALGAVATEHSAGHQGKLAARYVLHTSRGEPVEIMFEKGPRVPANLWVISSVGSALSNVGVRYRFLPASDTYATTDEEGRPRYGRHSALKPMRQLAHADLMCFTIEREGEIERLLEHVRAL